jgi:transposase
MTLLPAGVKVRLAFGYIDMRKGIDGLAMLVQGSCIRDRSPGISSCSEAARPT